ncbi:MAG: glycoside hydrolase family 2 [Solobacterium sp.]|nr:glycoside hydrolase family 2 [Solobacterium sp.]
MVLLSPWGEKLNTKLPLNEYPRMQMQRGSFLCLNGEWEFQINKGNIPDGKAFWEKIIVPFALGSKLSGTKKQLHPGEVLWYRRYFEYTPGENRVILNFEAVDQCCTVYVNGFEVGIHEGGYAPFSLDITEYVKPYNELVVRCTDHSDEGIYGFGKQRLKPEGIWYTPSSGIWQTVWIEELTPHAIYDLKILPDYDNKKVYLQMTGSFRQAIINVFEDRKLVHRGITAQKSYTITLDEIHPWSPDDPFLYDLYIETEDDAVRSYFGMRKFSYGPDEHGKLRFRLNNEPLFLSGLLDQGYTVDGLLTYPSDEAMRYELMKIKSMGFNMLRKHVKVECRRWYYLCDKLGILVMQDMPNGGGPYAFRDIAVLPTIGFRTFRDDNPERFGRKDPEGRKAYYMELDDMINNLYNAVCVFAWVPFNEGWGQFDSVKVTEHIREFDQSRLIDSTSGWHDQGAGDFNSRHVYFHHFHVPKADQRVLLLSEFGGYAYLEHGHSEADQLYGYKKFTDKLKLNDAVEDLYLKDILRNIPKGLAGCIYTQVADVENECNGLFTADRRILKIDERRMRRINDKLIRGNKHG